MDLRKKLCRIKENRALVLHFLEMNREKIEDDNSANMFYVFLSSSLRMDRTGKQSRRRRSGV